MGAKHGLENLLNQRIKASTFDSLNDPFELLSFRAISHREKYTLNELKRKTAQKFGILCFSKIWSNPVQWAHYAQKHEGLCIEVEFSDGNGPQKVNYVNERLDFQIESNPEFSKQILLTKFEHWHYEKEYRLIRCLENFEKENGLYFQTFCEEMKLSKIIIGCQSKITREQVLDNLNQEDKKVEIIYSRPSSKHFKIIEDLTK